MKVRLGGSTVRMMTTEKPSTNIEEWTDWPDDVRAALSQYNHDRKLRFQYHRRPGVSGSFRCGGCNETCQAHRYADAYAAGSNLCDECLILVARVCLLQVYR